jgi:hypothetical protein
MKKRQRSDTAANTLLPTNAPYPFCDPHQLGAKEPRKGSFEVLLTKGAYQRRPLA